MQRTVAVGVDWTLHSWRHNSSNVGGVSAGQARHNSSNVGVSLRVRWDTNRYSKKKVFILCLHRTVNRWNSLTEEVVSAPSLNSFKSRLDELWRGYSYIQNDCFSVRTHREDQLTGF